MFSSERKLAIAEYKKLYQIIGSVECPYFVGEKVFFNRKGFNHLLRRGKTPRFSAEQDERLALLKYCKNMLSIGHDYVEYRTVEKLDTAAFFWTFTARFENLNIKLVVRQIDNGQKHSFSIFPITHERPR